MTRAILLCPYYRNAASQQRLPEMKLAEARSLAETLGVEIIVAETLLLRETRPATLLGKGKVEAFISIIQENTVALVIIDAPLTPIQQRNLEKAWQCKVIDRTAMIIEIFAARARTSEGKLQVALAELEYRRSRLVRAWTHLERQRGGLGTIGGPGETQIEADRRMISHDISKIKRELEELRRTRQLHRSARKKVPYPIVALVGYTNAGKSTLFNRLTGASVLAEDKLFATLDPTMRMITLPSKQTIILSDTVGFISELPTELVVAFHATLEEVQEADLLLHVRDSTDPAMDAQLHDVEAVLRSLNMDEKLKTATLSIFNKTDRLDPVAMESLVATMDDNALPLSAVTGVGCTQLLEKIDAVFSKGMLEKTLFLSVEDGKSLAWLHAHAQILTRTEEETQICLSVRIRPALWEAFQREKNIA